MDVEKAIQSAKETRYTPTGEFGSFVPQRAWNAILEALSRQKAAGEAMKEALVSDYRKADAALTAWNSIEQGDGT